MILIIEGVVMCFVPLVGSPILAAVLAGIMQLICR